MRVFIDTNVLISSIIASAILSDSDILITGDKDFEGVQMEKPLILSPNKYFDFEK